MTWEQGSRESPLWPEHQEIVFPQRLLAGAAHPLPCLHVCACAPVLVLGHLCLVYWRCVWPPCAYLYVLGLRWVQLHAVFTDSVLLLFRSFY